MSTRCQTLHLYTYSVGKFCWADHNFPPQHQDMEQSRPSSQPLIPNEPQIIESGEQVVVNNTRLMAQHSPDRMETKDSTAKPVDALESFPNVQAGQSHGDLNEIPSAPGVPVDNIDYALATMQCSIRSTRPPKKIYS